MKKLILFDMLFWYCLYCMFTQNDSLHSAELAVYIVLSIKVLLCGFALFVITLINSKTVTHKNIKNYRPPTILTLIYSRVTTMLELTVMVLSGYLACGILYAICFLSTVYLHEKLLELKHE